MQFSVLSLLPLLCLPLTLAAPLAGPTPVLHERSTVISTITPSDVVLLKQATPTVSTPSIARGVVARTNTNSDITTLFTFYYAQTFPSNAVCNLRFINPDVLTGSGRLQLFTIGSNVTVGATWQSRPYRNNHVGTVRVVSGGEGVWEFGGTVPCPTMIGRVGYELVGAWDAQRVEWDVFGAGIRVEVVVP